MAKIHEDFKAVVGKTIFSDGKGKLFFGYYKEDDSVHFVDYKTWKKLSFKDVSKGNTNKERVIKAILKNQKQFNKKVDFNMWAKKNNPSFEQTMDWFIQNGWINNINKGGIKESIDVLSVNEGKKRFKQRDGIGSSKYTISYHDGVKKHKDGSDFFDIKIFKNKPELEAFKKALLQKGFVVESVNESASKEAMGIAGFTGTRGSAVEDFITKNELDGKKLFNFIRKGSLKDRMDFVTAIAGNPGNPIQKKIIKMFGESVNEAKFGYKDSTASYINKHNNEYKIAEKMNKGNEQKFYDDLQAMEDKIGHSKTMLFISNALRGYKVDMFKDPKIKNPADAQEALFLLSK